MLALVMTQEDGRTGTFYITKVASSSLRECEDVMDAVYRENPEFWPNGLSRQHFDGGLWLVREDSTGKAAGFTGWQERDEDGRKIGYYSVGILPHYRNRGMAKAAVRALIREKSSNVDCVKALVRAWNTPSLGLAGVLGVPVTKVAKSRYGEEHRFENPELVDASLRGALTGGAMGVGIGGLEGLVSGRSALETLLGAGLYGAGGAAFGGLTGYPREKWLEPAADDAAEWILEKDEGKGQEKKANPLALAPAAARGAANIARTGFWPWLGRIADGGKANLILPALTGGAAGVGAYQSGLDPASSTMLGLASGALASPKDWANAARLSGKPLRTGGPVPAPLTGFLHQLMGPVKMKAGIAGLSLVPAVATSVGGTGGALRRSGENVEGMTEKLRQAVEGPYGNFIMSDGEKVPIDKKTYDAAESLMALKLPVPAPEGYAGKAVPAGISKVVPPVEAMLGSVKKMTEQLDAASKSLSGAGQNVEKTTGDVSESGLGSLVRDIRDAVTDLRISADSGPLKQMATASQTGSESLKKMVDAATDNASWLTPLVGAGAGAAGGHMLAKSMELPDMRNKAERDKARRNRVLATLLGGAAGGALPLLAANKDRIGKQVASWMPA
jgi:RimJ/RimL family protein N-acetyltransferase